MALLTATVAEYDPADGISRLTFDGHALMVPGHPGPVGATLRIRVPAQDIILSKEPLQGVSALNILPVRVAALFEDPDVGGVTVALSVGGQNLLARVTRRSVSGMGLAVGQEIFAIVKATAIVSHIVK